MNLCLKSNENEQWFMKNQSCRHLIRVRWPLIYPCTFRKFLAQSSLVLIDKYLDQQPSPCWQIKKLPLSRLGKRIFLFLLSIWRLYNLQVPATLKFNFTYIRLYFVWVFFSVDGIEMWELTLTLRKPFCIMRKFICSAFVLIFNDDCFI